MVVLRHWAVVIGAAYARMPSFAPHRITVVNAPSAEPAAFALRQVKFFSNRVVRECNNYQPSERTGSFKHA